MICLAGRAAACSTGGETGQGSEQTLQDLQQTLPAPWDSEHETPQGSATGIPNGTGPCTHFS